jgi:hypothetical protein
VLAFSGGLWGEAVIADFWALSVLLFAGGLFLLTRWSFEPWRRQFLYGSFLLLGLLLTSSQEMIVVLPGMLVAVMITDPRLGREAAIFLLPTAVVLTGPFAYSIWIEFPNHLKWPLLIAFLIVALIALALVGYTRNFGSGWKPVIYCGICMCIGAAFYFYLPIASMTTPPANWGYARTTEGFFHILRRGQFEKLDPTLNPWRWLEQLWLLVANTGKEFGWPQSAVAFVPICLLHRMNPGGRRWVLGLLAVWIGVGPLMIAELNPPTGLQVMELIGMYFMAAHVVLAVWLGLGLAVLVAKVTRQNPRAADLVR